MNSDFTYYIYILIAIIAGIVIVKKVTSCLLKSVFLIAIVAVLVALYFFYFR